MHLSHLYGTEFFRTSLQPMEKLINENSWSNLNHINLWHLIMTSVYLLVIVIIVVFGYLIWSGATPVHIIE
jgi:hypothetical protein